MPPRCLPGVLFWAHPTGRRALARSQHAGEIIHPAWGLRITQEELEVMAEGKVKKVSAAPLSPATLKTSLRREYKHVIGGMAVFMFSKEAHFPHLMTDFSFSLVSLSLGSPGLMSLQFYSSSSSFKVKCTLMHNTFFSLLLTGSGQPPCGSWKKTDPVLWSRALIETHTYISDGGTNRSTEIKPT